MRELNFMSGVHMLFIIIFILLRNNIRLTNLTMSLILALSVAKDDEEAIEVSKETEYLDRF